MAEQAARPLGLPCGVIAIDGKSLGAPRPRRRRWGQRHTRDHDGSPYWFCAGAASGADLVGGKAGAGQLPIPPHTNEMGCFVAMFDAAHPTMRCLKSSPSMPA